MLDRNSLQTSICEHMARLFSAITKYSKQFHNDGFLECWNQYPLLTWIATLNLLIGLSYWVNDTHTLKFLYYSYCITLKPVKIFRQYCFMSDVLCVLDLIFIFIFCEWVIIKNHKTTNIRKNFLLLSSDKINIMALSKQNIYIIQICFNMAWSIYYILLCSIFEFSTDWISLKWRII